MLSSWIFGEQLRKWAVFKFFGYNSAKIIGWWHFNFGQIKSFARQKQLDWNIDIMKE